MRLVEKLAGDEFKAKYGYTKFYITEFVFLTIKSIFVVACSMIFFLAFFFILRPDPTNVTLRPIFQVKKMNENNMITIFTNKETKRELCNNQSAIYYGKLYTKQQFCQFEHINFPFEIENEQIDVSLLGMTKNVQFITACIFKVHEDRSVCQKFAYGENVKIFNNLKFQSLYSIEIELTLKNQNQFFGEVQILFEQQNSFIIQFLKEYYFLVSILASLSMSGILTFSFIVFQITEILQKAEAQQKKVKEA